MANEQMKKNGNAWKWIIGIIAGLVLTALASINALGVFQGETKTQAKHNSEAIQEIKPEIAKNTEHRIKFEEKVDNMEKNIRLILEAVKNE